MTRRSGGAALALALLAAGAAPARAKAEEQYWISDVGTFGGATAWSRRLNAAGQVAATAQGVPDGSGGGVDRAFLFTAGTSVAITLDGGWSNVVDLNDAGQVLAVGGTGPFLYDAGTYRDLAADGLDQAADLGPAGHVAGASYDPVTGSHAAVWYDGQVTRIADLLAPLGEMWSEARFVNGKGEVVGVMTDAAWTQRVFLYSGGTVAFVDPLTDTLYSEDGRFGSLNENSMVAGFYQYSTDPWHTAVAYVWQGFVIDLSQDLGLDFFVRGLNDRNDLFGNQEPTGTRLRHGVVFTYDDQTAHDVGSLGGDTCSHGVNGRGHVVGHSNLPGNGPYHGQDSGPNFIYRDGALLDLNALVAPGSGIFFADWGATLNDAGQVLVTGWNEAGTTYRPVLLTPFPETAISYAGARRQDGWYTTNVIATLTAAAVPGVAQLRYQVDGGMWVTVPRADASFALTKNGTHRVTFYAVDTLGHAAAPRTAFVSIDKGGVLVTTASLPAGVAGLPFVATLAAKGGQAPYQYHVTGGSLPAGVSLWTNGAFTGAPASPGKSAFTVRVTDARGATGFSYFAVEVVPPLQVTTPAVVDGTGSMNVALTAAGGTPPYRWAIDAATPLPAGFAHDFATIWPTGPGSLDPLPLRVLVTDAAGRTEAADLTLGIVPVTVKMSASQFTVPPGWQVWIQVDALGGTGAFTGYTFALEGAPPAFYLSGPVITGTPAPGTYELSVVATDGSGNASAPFPVTITVQ